jgi:hypothetical protein
MRMTSFTHDGRREPRLAKIFISYQHGDLGLADEILGLLEGDGHEAFIDREGIRAGERWRDRIATELRNADVIVPVVTERFMVSSECVAEVAVAADRGKRIVPVAAGGDPRAIPHLENLHFIDWQADPHGIAGRVVPVSGAEALRQRPGLGVLWPLLGRQKGHGTAPHRRDGRPERDRRSHRPVRLRKVVPRSGRRAASAGERTELVGAASGGAE